MAPIIDAPKGLIIKKNGVMVMESPTSLNVRSPYAFDVEDMGNDECRISLPFVPQVLPFGIGFISAGSTGYSIPYLYTNIDSNTFYYTSGLKRYFFNVAGIIKNFKLWFESRSNIQTTTLTGRIRIGSGNGSASNTLLSVAGSTNQSTWIILEDADESHSVSVNVGDWIEFQGVSSGTSGVYNIGGYMEFYFNE